MPIYFFWGEDDFAMNQSIQGLRTEVLDPQWIDFNFDRFSGEESDSVIQALTQTLTPPFGMGGRLIWVQETTLGQQCSSDLFKELERTFPQIPDHGHLLFTSGKKPDGRLPSTKLLHQAAQVKEFPLLPPWQTEALRQRTQQVAQSQGVHLAPRAIALLAEAVGNDTRRLWNELGKLKLYQGDRPQPLTAEEVGQLVTSSSQTSLQLAQAILQGDSSRALGLLEDLLNLNHEPALRVVATLVGQFRLWTMVQLLQEQGEKDDKIAQAAELGNPKRLYFIRQELGRTPSTKLLPCLPILADLEYQLKRGGDPLSSCQTHIVELCDRLRSSTPPSYL